jgi:hypothetical protein
VRELHGTPAQPDLLTAPAPPDPLLGLLVQLPDRPCACGSELAVTGPGKAMHALSLRCAECEKHRGWVGQQTHRFLAETVNKFGTPPEPITIRTPLYAAGGARSTRAAETETS